MWAIWQKHVSEGLKLNVTLIPAWSSTALSKHIRGKEDQPIGPTASTLISSLTQTHDGLKPWKMLLRWLWVVIFLICYNITSETTMTRTTAGCCTFWMNPLKSGGDCKIVVSLIFFFSFFMSSQTQCHFAGGFDGFNRAAGWMKSNLYVKSISKCWDVVSNTPHLILLPSLLFPKSQRFSVKLSQPNTEIISM